MQTKRRFNIGSTGFVLGPVLFFAVVLAPFDGLSFEAKAVLGLALWMGTWWVTEAIPIYVTALLPLVLFPLLNVTDFGKTSSFYADRIVFLLLGGFFLAATIERSNLHQRFAFTMLKFSGTNPKYIVGAFVIVTGFTALLAECNFCNRVDSQVLKNYRHWRACSRICYSGSCHIYS
jgi:sodium-dependent dicarboxylate transporter 2/3/5